MQDKGSLAAEVSLLDLVLFLPAGSLNGHGGRNFCRWRSKLERAVLGKDGVFLVLLKVIKEIPYAADPESLSRTSALQCTTSGPQALSSLNAAG